MNLQTRKPELLLPVGNMEMCMAAIHHGADAIYVGVPKFNARGRTHDFSLTELKEMIDLCHLYGVKVNLALNIVIFENELDEIISLLKEILVLSPDALIVQDLGLLQIIRKLNPHQRIHASTQMTVTNYESIELLSDLKIDRFVLGRENSLEEIRSIRAHTQSELEVFVHGALCVAYSGQCFTSESLGGRSANRGQCAQSCRFEYELIADGKKIDLNGRSFLVSPKDLCGIAQIPDLCEIGIDCFKVEGRLKGPEYVSSAAANYKTAINTAINHQRISIEQIEKYKFELSGTYSRGFFTGWLGGVDHQKLVDGISNEHQGAYLGKVLEVKKPKIKLNDRQDLEKGDGLLLRSIIDGKKQEFGSKIFNVEFDQVKNETWISLDFDFPYLKIKKGFDVYLNFDRSVKQRLSQTKDKNQQKKIPISLSVKAKINSPIEIRVKDDRHVIQLTGPNIEVSNNPNPSKDFIKSELSSLSHTCFKVDTFDLECDDNIFIHQKELKKLRQEFTQRLMQKRVERPQVTLNAWSEDFKTYTKSQSFSSRLNLLLRTFEQVEALVDSAVSGHPHLGIVILDFEYGRDYVPSVKKLKEKGFTVAIATTRVLKPGEYHNFKLIERARPDVVLVRNLGALNYFKNKSEVSFELKGDFSLNATNHLSVNYLISKGLSTICPSYDLNAEQVSLLAKHCQPSQLEMTIHQYMPSFHMEHCVFAAFLSKGSSFRDCGKPCEKVKVEMKDQFGHVHHLKADQECRNTMFNAEAQSAASFLNEWEELGIREFRFEALNENREMLLSKIEHLLSFLSHQIDLATLHQNLKSHEKYGLGLGHLSIEKNYKSRKKPIK